MTIREIEILLEVARCLNMTAAARNLYISQSTVSQVIIGIETSYGVTLFERRNKKLLITEQGRTAVTEAAKVMKAFANMEHAIKFVTEDTLRLGTNLITASSILNNIWGEYHKKCTNVKTKIVIDDDWLLKDKLLDDELDFVLSQNCYERSDLKCEIIAEDDYVFICSPSNAFSDRHSISLTELKDEALIMREKGNPTRTLFDQINEESGTDLKILAEYKNIDVIKDEVSRGNAVSIIAKKLIARELAGKKIFSCPVDEITKKRHFYIIYHKNLKIKPHFKCFIETCKIAS